MIFGKSKKEDPFITRADHKRIVNELMGSIIQINLIVATWSKELIEAAEKTNNREVIAFSKNLLLSLKKKLAENLLKTTGNNDRV